jgi:hypothetical protein
LNDYLNGGGNLYVESVNLGIDHIATQFLINLGIKYASDGTGHEVLQLIGENNHFMEQFQYDYMGGINAHYSIDKMNNVDAAVLFRAENEISRMFINEGANFRTIASTIVFGAIADGNNLDLKAYLISEMVNYLLGISTVTTVQENISNMLRFGLSYPNPFTETTTIEYTLSEAGKVKVDIHDLRGLVVKHLIDGEQAPGLHQLTWDATGDNGRYIASGCYFYRITAGQAMVSEKIILLK